jgi:hypothetical protein
MFLVSVVLYLLMGVFLTGIVTRGEDIKLEDAGPLAMLTLLLPLLLIIALLLCPLVGPAYLCWRLGVWVGHFKVWKWLLGPR